MYLYVVETIRLSFCQQNISVKCEKSIQFIESVYTRFYLKKTSFTLFL